MNDRYVVVGLARSRSRWFSEMTRWSTSSVIPVDYMKAISSDEVRAILGSGRPVSALVVDASVPGVDRELISVAVDSKAVVIVVAGPTIRRDWTALGAAAVLDEDFTPDELTDALRRYAAALGPTRRRSAGLAVSMTDVPVRTARCVAVTGPGGTGSSTVAMATAQSLTGTEADRTGGSAGGRSGAAGRSGAGGRSGDTTVALVDGVRRSQLALYHDVGDVIPGLPELVDAHRGDRPDPDEIRKLLFPIEARGYDLLLGQRSPRQAASLGPMSTMAAIEGVTRAYDTVVFDIDPNLDGEGETGSVDIENHHGVARAVTDQADLVLLVIRPGMKGMHDLTHLVDSFSEFGVAPEQLVPIVNFAPRTRAARATLTRLVAQLTTFDAQPIRPPIFLPTVRTLEDVHNCASRLPSSLTVHLGRAVTHLLDDSALGGDDAPDLQHRHGSVERSRIEVA